MATSATTSIIATRKMKTMDITTLLASLLCLVFLSTILAPCADALTFLGERETYAKFPKWDACTNATIMFEFKTRQPDALLMYTDDSGRYDYLQVTITGGSVILWINFIQEEGRSAQITLGKDLNDGEWHQVEIKRNRMETTLLVDDTQLSKVIFGDNFNISDLETNNYMYFGGIPLTFMSNYGTRELPESVTGNRFIGQIRNVLYFNCTCLPVRASPLELRGSRDYPREACDLENPCSKDCPCISGDDGPGCWCEYRQECYKDLLADYRLPMDRLDGDLIVNPSGLDSKVYGNPQLVDGVKDMSLQLIGAARQYARVAGPSHKQECFGDLDHCPKGYYLSMWIQFDSTPRSKAVYMSNGAQDADGHGVAMSYSPDGLEFVFKMKDGRQWTATARDVQPRRWYHVLASWDLDQGLYVYVNGIQQSHDAQPSRVRAARDPGNRLKEFILGRSNDPTDQGQRVDFKVDEFTFVSAYASGMEARELGSFYHYHLPMDEIRGNNLIMVGGTAIVTGPAQTVPGRIRNAVSFSGRGEFVDLGDAREKCLGNLEECKQGFYMSFFFKSNRLESSNGYIFSSPHGMNVYHTGSTLVAQADSGRRTWQARYNGLRVGTWHFVEISWSKSAGLTLMVDGQEVDRTPRELSAQSVPVTNENRVFLGRSNSGARQDYLTNAMLDNMDIFYGTRDMLARVHFIRSGRPTHYHINFENVRGDRVIHNDLVVSLVGSPIPEQIDGRLGKAIELNSTRRQAVVLGDQTRECLGNLDLCHRGVMYAMWLRPDSLSDGETFLSTSGQNGLTLTYRNQRLYATARTGTQEWEASTSGLSPERWNYLEVSYHPLTGLSLYLNNELVAEDMTGQRRLPSTIGDDKNFYLGRSSQRDQPVGYADAAIDELEAWYSDRDYLVARGYIQRSEPQHFFIPFEDMVSVDQLSHPTLTIRLVGRPRLVPGKVSNALQLTGRGQYADLGRRGTECLSNLAACTRGLTIAAWMKFERFENNMVFLSTGENGILMQYKDGYIQVSADGRGVLSIPRFNTERWYFVEISWHPQTGMQLYVDGELKAESAANYVAASSNRGSFRIGHPNQGDVPTGRYSTGNFEVDEMEIWYGRREDLMAFGYINRGNMHNRGYAVFSFDEANGRRIVHDTYRDVVLVNGARIGPGRFRNAVLLEGGRSQYVDLGRHFDSCLGNIDRCPHGMTLSVYLNPRDLRRDQTFIAAPTHRLYFEDRRLKAEVNGRDRMWTTETNRLREGAWQRVTFTWHPKKGLTLYVDDDFVGEDRVGVTRRRPTSPASEHVYVGRSLVSDRVTSVGSTDELQVWYDDLDHLRATGQYRAQVLPYRIGFNDFRNNEIIVRDRVIRGYGDFRIVRGKGINTRGIMLAGTNGYLDLGDNFTCAGDLGTCQQGATLRLGIRPSDLRDGQVFFDSFPMKVWYRDGRLYGRLQTQDKFWQVETRNFRPGVWQRVELTWHPRDGLLMYIDGRRVDYQTYAENHSQPQIPTDWVTYFGRSIEGGRTYANAVVDNIEFWTAYRDYIPADGYLRIPVYIPPTPRPRPRTTPRPVFPRTTPQLSGDGSRQVTTMTFNGRSFVQFDFSRLPQYYFQRAEKEEFQFYFSSTEPNGLIWLHEYQGRKIYLALRNGQLVFGNDDGTGAPEETVWSGSSNNFNNGMWYLFKLDRDGRKIRMTVDGKDPKDYIFSRNVQFIVPAQVYLGGTANTYQSTSGRVAQNFKGTLALIVLKTFTPDLEANRLYRNEVNLITQLAKQPGGNPGVDFSVVTWPDRGKPVTVPTPRPRPTTPAPPRVTTITLTDRNVYLRLINRFEMRSGSSLDFKFQTINREGLLVLGSSNIPNKNFFTLEIYDGMLYLVHNFGGRTRRTLLSDTEVSDGQMHEVQLRFLSNRIDARLDSKTSPIALEQGESLPANLAYIYLGGYSTYAMLPWHTWARQGYQGCLEDINVNGRLVDFYDYLQRQQLFGRVEQNCLPMPRKCSTDRPCNNGFCTNLWNGFKCDCSATDYSGVSCSNYAWTGVFNGSVRYRMRIMPQQKYHVNNISFRFKTMVPDGLIFQTKANNDGQFIRAELDNGRMLIVTNLGGDYKTFTIGEDLNDMEWHTVYIQRRGDNMEVWVDDQTKSKAVLPQEGFYLFVDNVYIGGYTAEDNLNIPSDTKNYVGYLRNFYFGGYDVFDRLHAVGEGGLYQYPNIPPLVFHDFTLPDYETFIRLPGLGSLDKVNMRFQFKTNDPNGVIFFNEGRSQDIFAVELYEGRLYVLFAEPGMKPVRVPTPKGRVYNDGKWHAVSIIHREVEGQRQLDFNVDGQSLSFSYSGADSIALQGDVYIGGIPSTFFAKEHIARSLYSKTGYRGCLASVDFGRGLPDMRETARVQGVTIYDTCKAILSKCTKDTCFNGGICHDHLNNGTTWCDCTLTGWGGPQCLNYPLGYYFRSQGKADQYGMMVYRYPKVKAMDSERDEIVFGVMTDTENAVLLKLLSSVFFDSIEFKLVDGLVQVNYDTEGKGVINRVRNGDVYVSDGGYHVVRFVRTKDRATLYVDGKSVFSKHSQPHMDFTRLDRIYVGGLYQSDKIVNGTGMHGIIGGLNVNEHMIFYDARDGINTRILFDAVVAPTPYTLGVVEKEKEVTWKTEPPVIPVTPVPLPKELPIIPGDVGGGGIAWAVGGGGDVFDVVVFPEGSGGSAGAVPGGLPAGDGTPAAIAQVGRVPSLPTIGPRAGALMGTLLGLAALAASLMWAFYRCKPGWCGGAGAGAGGPVSISAPRTSASNIGAVQAASAAANANSAGADMDSPDTALLAGSHANTVVVSTANGGSAAYYAGHSNASSAAHQRQESYDSATLRAMGTFSNRGTALGTAGGSSAHNQFSSSTSGYSESNMVASPASMQSYQFENANPDYDVATGVHSNYNSNTLTAGGANAGGFSTSTMSSNYNYSVKTVKTVGGQQSMLGYGAGSLSNVIVTPGAMGEEVRVDCCLMTNDGHSVVTGSSLGPPQVWNMSNGELLRIMQGETVGSTFLHLVNSDRLLVGAINADLEVNQYSVPKGVHNYTFQVWDTATGRPLDMAERETLSALCIANDGEKVVFGRSDKFGGGTNIILWDLLGNQPVKEMRYDAPVGNNDYISYINMSQNDRYVIAGYTNTFDNFAEFVLMDTHLTSYNVSDPNILRLDAAPEVTAVLPRDEAVTGLRNGDLVVWNIRTGQPSRQLLSNAGKHAHDREVKDIARSEDSRFLVSASVDGTLKLWDLESERHICTMNGHNDEVWCCAISSDNEIIVSGSRDGTIRLWRLRNGQEICAFNAGVDVFYITMSHDKGTIVALGDKYGARKLIMLQVVRSKVKRQVPA